MGREIRRVPVDFNWPLHATWWGFINPWQGLVPKCPACSGPGYSEPAEFLWCLWYHHRHHDAAQRLPYHVTYGIPDAFVRLAHRVLTQGVGWHYALDQEDVDVLADGNHLRDFTHVPREGFPGGECWPNGHTREPTGYRPTADEVNAWSRTAGVFGLDVTAGYVCIIARCERAGVPHICPACRGDGVVHWPALDQRVRRWRKTEPPRGDGWQVWETVSEGSPISPVFTGRDSLVAWLTGQGYSHAAAEAFAVDDASVSSFVVDRATGRRYDDIESAVLAPTHREEPS